MAKIYFFWDGDNLLQEHNQAGATVAHYVTEPDQYGNVISQRRSGTTHVYHYDATGSTTELTNDSGIVTDTWRNTAFGQSTEQTGEAEFPFKFVGQLGYYFDEETATYFVRQRYLVVETGRWLSQDNAASFDAILTPYHYVGNMPLVLTDPTGLQVVRPTAPNPFQSPAAIGGAADVAGKAFIYLIAPCLLGAGGAVLLERAGRLIAGDRLADLRKVDVEGVCSAVTGCFIGMCVGGCVAGGLATGGLAVAGIAAACTAGGIIVCDVCGQIANRRPWLCSWLPWGTDVLE